AEHDFSAQGATFPFGAHVAVVEVDTETGLVTPVRHVAVDDCGRVLNPMLVAGQQMGGVAQGVAQALWEEFVYDAEGQPITSSFVDYAMPAATEMPPMTLANTVTETPLNPLGAKGIGESATVGSTPAVQNAVVDALSHLGVRHLDMPLKPDRIVAAVQAAASGSLPDPWREPPSAYAEATPRKRSPTSDGQPVGGSVPFCSSSRITCWTALISARCVNACGKLPRCCPLCGSISSPYSSSGPANDSSLAQSLRAL